MIKLEYVWELSMTNGIIWEMGPQQVHWEGYSSLAAILEGGSWQQGATIPLCFLPVSAVWPAAPRFHWAESLYEGLYGPQHWVRMNKLCLL